MRLERKEHENAQCCFEAAIELDVCTRSYLYFAMGRWMAETSLYFSIWKCLAFSSPKVMNADMGTRRFRSTIIEELVYPITGLIILENICANCGGDGCFHTKYIKKDGWVYEIRENHAKRRGVQDWLHHGKGSWSLFNDNNMRHSNLMKADGASVGGFSSTKSSCSSDTPR